MKRVQQIQVWRLLENIHQIVEGVQAIFLGGLNDAVGHGTGLCPGWSVGKQPVFSTNDERLHTAFGPVVGNLQPAVQQVPFQIFSL